MPLTKSKDGSYYFDRVPGDPLPGRCFQHNGRTYEIIGTQTTGKKAEDCIHEFCELGTKGKVYRIEMRELVKKLTGEDV